MANGFESQKINRTSIDDLLRLVQGLGQMGAQQQQRKQRAFDELHKEYESGISGIYDNSQLNLRKSQFDKYYQENKANMDENTLAKYELLDQKFKSQEQQNNDYIQGLERTKEIGRQVESALMDYSDINANTSLSESEKNDLRKEKMANVQSLVDGYTSFSGDFRRNHGERLNKAGFRQDAAYIANLNEMFTFGIVQAKDDYLLDNAEAEALALGIQTGSYEPIKDYRINESNRNRDLNNFQQKEMKELYDSYELNSDYIKKANNFMELAEKSANEEGLYSAEEQENAKIEMDKLSEQTFYADDDNEFMYEELLSTDSGAFNLYLRAVEANDESYSKLENINNIYMRRNNASYLQEINTSDAIKDDIDFIINPDKKPEVVVDDEIPLGIKAPEDIVPGPQLPSDEEIVEDKDFGKLSEKDYTKDLERYEASTKSMVKQVNNVSKAIDAYNIKVNEIENLSNQYLKKLKDSQEENEMLKEEGIRWTSADRRKVRSDIKKARSEYISLFQTTPTASSIAKIKKLIEKEELPQYMEVIAGEAAGRGISINEYIEFMKTSEYDNFLDKKMSSLENKYKVKKKNLESIVKRGSKK